MEAWKRLSLNTRFPGIMYTGRQDGMCCVAYDLARVKPLATLYAPDVILRVATKTLAWRDLTCPDLRRKLRPLSFLPTDIAQYTVSLDILQHTLRKTPDVFAAKCFKGYRAAKTVYDKMLWMQAVHSKTLLRRMPPDFLAFVCQDVAKSVIKDNKVFLPYLNGSIFLPYFMRCEPSSMTDETYEAYNTAQNRFEKMLAHLITCKGFADAYSAALIADNLKKQKVVYAKLHKRLQLLKTPLLAQRVIQRVFQPFNDRLVSHKTTRKSGTLIRKKRVRFNLLQSMPTSARYSDSVEMLMEYCLQKRSHDGNWRYNRERPIYYTTRDLLNQWETAQRALLVEFYETLYADPAVMTKHGVKALLDMWWSEKGHNYVWSTLKL